ncbi:MAG: DUF3276 family protein [Bacteroidaceae bacterium]|nr:DUF3276 family protein [Bacteroidaceae bacterium]
MKQFENSNDKNENEILFSKSVKAGKRIYYVDVKRDRHDEYYLSVTESKRIKDGTEETRPVFEKHKIFLYREDLEKFMEAFNEAADFAIKNQPVPTRLARYAEQAEQTEEQPKSETFNEGEIKLGEIEF